MTSPAPVPPQAIADERERLGRIACEAWEKWASEQPSPWPIRRAAWQDCHPGTRESFRRIGEAVAAAERERCAQILDQHDAHYGCYAGIDTGKGTVVTSGLRPAASLLRKDRL